MSHRLKFAVYKFHWIWWCLLVLSISITFIISYFSEVQEIFTWGYELGFFLFPFFSSVFISILIFFFTSHLMESSEKYEEYVSFDEFISFVREFLNNVHLDSGIKMESPNFK
ncbi:hypothetical protein GCM10027164_21210 [Algoriphagus taiwanensis]|uniref:Uncharacterized protein n=1 Tax=Algoriphagus taiwanensis TaxID=1445656 RepID=A0ABQ6Q0P1_9BACT|nr:hypothetical protein Ataiwa_08740 [Algoriphagus taiwanensis]